MGYEWFAEQVIQLTTSIGPSLFEPFMVYLDTSENQFLDKSLTHNDDEIYQALSKKIAPQFSHSGKIERCDDLLDYSISRTG